VAAKVEHEGVETGGGEMVGEAGTLEVGAPGHHRVAEHAGSPTRAVRRMAPEGQPRTVGGDRGERLHHD
jgi:hypothetical protein